LPGVSLHADEKGLGQKAVMWRRRCCSPSDRAARPGHFLLHGRTADLVNIAGSGLRSRNLKLFSQFHRRRKGTCAFVMPEEDDGR